MELHPESRGERPTRVRWEIFSVALATSAILYLHRYSLGFVKNELARDWQLNNTELGHIDSAFALCYSGFQFPLALAADGIGVRVVLAILTSVWSLGLAFLAVAPGTTWVMLAEATIGAGQSAVYACLSRLARQWYPPAVRATLQGIVSVFAGRLGALGASLFFATLLLGTLAVPWRSAVAFQAVTAGALAIVILVVVRDDPRRDRRVNDAERQLLGAPSSLDCAPSTPNPSAIDSPASDARAPTSGAASSNRSWFAGTSRRTLVTLAFLSAQAILSTFADNVFSNWLPRFLKQVHDLDFQRMGIFTSLPLLGGALAGFVGGALNDHLAARWGRRRWARAGVAILGKGGAALALCLALTQFDRPYVFCGLLFVVKALSDWSLVSALGVVADLGGRATASIFALNNTVAGIGQFAAPLVIGRVADAWGWRPVFAVIALAYLLCAATWLGIDADAPEVGAAAEGSRAASP